MEQIEKLYPNATVVYIKKGGVVPFIANYEEFGVIVQVFYFYFIIILVVYLFGHIVDIVIV